MATSSRRSTQPPGARTVSTPICEGRCGNRKTRRIQADAELPNLLRVERLRACLRLQCRVAIVACMTGPFADKLFRIAFAAAGVYNLAFGIWAAVWPFAFFQLFEIPAPNYPGIWACLGMVVGLYGLLYLYAAWKLEAASPIVAVGLLGKLLGPIGMAMSLDVDWPRRVGMICVFNDLIWWLPFGLFLIRGTTLGRRLAALAPSLCIFAHVVALAMLVLVLRYGGLTEPDAAVRSQYVAQHVTSWTTGWGAWMFAAATLVGFYAW